MRRLNVGLRRRESRIALGFFWDSNMSDSKNWKQLIIAGAIGAVFTGVTQYLILQKNHSAELETARIIAKRELLITELNERKQSYQEVRKKFVEFYRSQNEMDKEALLISLRAGMPFFEPRFGTQRRIESAAQSAGIWIDQTNMVRAAQSLEQLEIAFQADLERIQNSIDEL